MHSPRSRRTLRPGAVPVADVLICRICFTTDCELYSMWRLKNLDKAFEDLTGLATQHDSLPPYLCRECARRLLDYAQFRTASLQAHSTLLDIVKKYGHVKLELLQREVNIPLNMNPTKTDLDIELTNKENTLTNEHADMKNVPLLWNVSVCGIKVENDGETTLDRTNEEPAVKNSTVAVMPEYVAVGSIKSEREDMVDRDSDTIDEGPASLEYVAVDKVKVESDCVYQNNTDEDVDTSSAVKHRDKFVGDCLRSDDSCPVAPTTRRAEPSAATRVSEPPINAGHAPADRTLSVTDELSCDICHYKTIHSSNLTRHNRVHSKKKTYSCDVCHKTIVHKSSFARHVSAHSGEKSFSCDVCHKEYIHKSSLTAHVRTHLGDKPFSCDVCDREFVLKSSLAVHLKTHSDSKPYTCVVCNKSFNHRISLVRHSRTHSGDRPFACDVCNKSFTCKGDLTAHLRTHSTEKSFSCEVCRREFVHKSSLTTHSRTHLKPFACCVCNKSFGYRVSLKRHLMKHSGEKPISCDV